MSRILSSLILGIATIGLSVSAVAANKSTEAEALALLDKAQEYIRVHGLKKAIIEFNKLDSPFNSKSEINQAGDLYLFSVNSKGEQAVHGKSPKIRGKNTIAMKDVDGVELIRLLVKKCYSKEGRGLVDYKWPHPITKVVEAKRGYIQRVAGVDFCIGTGVYK